MVAGSIDWFQAVLGVFLKAYLGPGESWRIGAGAFTVRRMYNYCIGIFFVQFLVGSAFSSGAQPNGPIVVVVL